MEIVSANDEVPDSGSLVVAVGPDGTLAAAAEDLDRRSGGTLRRALALAGKLEHGRLVDLLLPRDLPHDRVILAVCGGSGGRLGLEELGGSLARRIGDLQLAEATLAPLDGLDLPLPPSAASAALAAGVRLRSASFRRYKSAAPGNGADPVSSRLTVLTREPTGELVETELALADAVIAARDLVSEPANVLTPSAFAARCRGLEELGVSVEILDEAELERIGMRALLAVAQGSVQRPYVAIMRWRGADEDRPLALVGKGVCFDSGGISIKPGAGMEAMKGDMAGAAAVVGAIRALAARRARADVVGVIGLVENMPSGTAQRPGDVVRTLAGKTVEIINTDAEGRLLLADVLWYTADRFKPRAMIDLATLTGAITVALGQERAGLFASDDALAADLAAAGEEVGERLWRMPLGKAYAKHVRSEIADLKNVGRGREAGAIAGAVFLEPFTAGVPWAHLDIAGVAWSSRDSALAARGATGFGVRLLDRLVARAESAGATHPLG